MITADIWTDVARCGWTSITMLEKHFAHLLVSSAESARSRMDDFYIGEAEEL